MFISLPAIEALFHNATDAMVVCRLDGEEDQPDVRLEFLNPSALSLLGFSHRPAAGAPLRQLLTDESLYTDLKATQRLGHQTSGCLSQADRPIDYEIHPLGDWLTIRLRASDQPGELAALGSHLLATGHLSVALLDPVPDSAGEVIDFRLARLYESPDGTGAAQLQERYLGTLLSVWNPETKKSGLFRRYVAVMQGGQPFQTEQYYAGLNIAFDVAASRVGNQLLLTYRRTTDIYRVKRQVEQQAAILDAMMQSTQDYISVYQAIRDESGTITDFKGLLFSDAIYNLSPLTKDDFLSTSLKQLHPSTAVLFDQYVNLVETGVPTRSERVLHGEGGAATRWFDVSASKVLDGFVSITKEITQYKQALQQVEAQSQMLETILNNSDSYIYVADPIRSEAGEIVDFRITRSNEAGRLNMIRTVGYDGTGSTLLTMYPFSTEWGLFAGYVKVVETGEPMATEFFYEYGHIREWMKISAQKMGEGLVVTYVDISESRRAAESAEKYAQQLKGVLDASLNGIILLEAMRDQQGEVIDFRYLLANQSASKINNVPLDQLIGNTLLTLFPSSKTEGSFPGNVYALKTGNPIRKQLKLICDRMEGWYDFTSNRISADNLVVSFTDITETKMLEERQHKLVDELKRSNQNLKEFAYVASHDLQEPLRKITSFGSILKNKYAPLLGEDGTDLIERMESASLRMSVLINDLLAYSRLATRAQPIQARDLGVLVREVIDDLELVIADKNALVEVGPLVTVPGDATQLAQLFHNLLTNALKFAKNDVRPHIRISGECINRADLPAGFDQQTRHETYGFIQVKDNGIGFDPSQSERIFGTFQRLHGKGKYPGTGIGLAIVKKVVENHAGYILAEGRPGEGATFSIYLPA